MKILSVNFLVAKTARIVIMAFVSILCISMAYAQEKDDFPPTPRPQIGLVLSGGGAKGAAHIGVLKALEELQIPIDYVVGTSMGSIMSGLYAVGYTSDELDTMISNLNWSVILSNQGEWGNTSYSEKRLKEKNIFSIPFTGHIFNPKFQEGSNNVNNQNYRLLSEMPSGVINGQNVMDLFKSLTVGYQGNQNFDSLPIPFACVAADIANNKEVVQRSGELSEAIRASMAIPGVFAPVNKGDTVLVDGGVMNNYPVDVALEMGADIIIGVHLGLDLQPAEKLDNMLGIFSQLFGIMLHNKIAENVKNTDFLILPNIEGYNMLSFSKKNITNLIALGYQAAMEKREELESLRAMLDSCGYDPAEKIIPHSRKARNVNYDTFAIKTISFEGMEPSYRSLLNKKLMGFEIKENTRVAGTEIRNAVSALYSSSMFESVDYQLLGSEEPYDLVFHLKPNSSHSLSLGARFDIEEFSHVLVNLTLNRYRLYTPKISTSIILGLNPSIDVDMSYPMGTLSKIVLYDCFSSNNFRMFGQNSVLRDINFNYNTLKIFVSTASFRSFNMELGIKMDNFFIKSFTGQELLYTGSKNMGTSTFLEGFADFEFNPLNNSDLSQNGFTTRLMGDFYFLGSSENFSYFATIQLNAKGVFNITRTTQLNPALYHRTLFSTQVPAIYGNVAGGYNEGRYVEHQIPFIGMNYADFFDKNMTVYRIDVRQKLFEKQYVTLMANYATHCHDIKEYFYGSSLFGVGLSYTYDIPVVGPATVLMQWSSHTKSLSWMFSLGFFF